jgi:DeoR/GlpR family transcriptional regulator of sugar metabolism
MIKAEREARILSFLNEAGVASIHDLVARLGRVSEVTVRRDVARLAAEGALRRSHGGVSKLDSPRQKPAAGPALWPAEDIGLPLDDTDAIVLPPLEGKGAETLRLMARRRGIPFLAESAPQAGGIYLGSDNVAAGRDLGIAAARELAGSIGSARILMVSLEALPNTRARCDGFLAGFTEAFDGAVRHWRVDGRGIFRSALRASLDALQAHPDINVLFGVNDHSILAALEAAERLGLDAVSGFSVGGEGGALFDALVAGGRLSACCALFPELVGQRAVDVLAEALNGGAMPAEVKTPHAILTRANLADYYRRGPAGWSFAPAARLTALAAPVPARPASRDRRRPRIGFVPHYPAHDWYRNMRRAMEHRAEALGLELAVAAPQAGIAHEIRAIRRVIARAAAAEVAPGDTILVNHGEVSLFLAEELRGRTDITVVTNSLDVLERLSGQSGLKVIMTSGEPHLKARCLVGPSLGALFETLRVDKAFLAVDGISARFGPSASDERMALAARRFVDASREVHVMADHSLVGQDANHRIVALDRVDELITDSGSLPADRLAFASAGTGITIADEETGNEERPAHRPLGPLHAKGRPEAIA